MLRIKDDNCLGAHKLKVADCECRGERSRLVWRGRAGAAGEVVALDVQRAAVGDVCAQAPSCSIGCAPLGKYALSQAW